MDNKLLKSSSLLVFMRLIYRSLGLISMLILARLLVPEDFGIIAITAMFIFFFDVLSNTGIQQYLVQKEDVDDEDINSAWTLDLIIKGTMALLSLAISPLVAIFYDNPQIGYAVAVLSLAIILRALMHPGLHILRRNLEYSLIFKISVLQKVIAVMVVISIAYYFKSFWAMVAGDIVSAFVGVALSYRYCDVRPQLSTERIKEQWHFSKWMLSKGVIGYARAQIDIFLVSRFFPMAQVGQYNLSKEITVMPAFDIIRPAVEPLIATLSKVRGDMQEFNRQFSYSILVIMLLIAPICIFLLYYSDILIGVVLGEKWSAVAPITEALTIMLFAYSFGSILNNVFLALGKVKAIFLYDVFSLIFVTVVLLSISFDDIVNFAYWRSYAAIVVTVIFLVFTVKIINCKIAPILSSISGPFLASSISIYIVKTFNFTYCLIDLLLLGIFYLFTYLIVALLLAFCLHKVNSVAAVCYLFTRKKIKSFYIARFKD